MGVTSAVAQGASPCATSGPTTTCTYTASGTYSFTVPAGVTSLDVTAVGAAGGNSCTSCGVISWDGGAGASVEDTAVPVNPGEAFTVVVGGAGGTGSASAGGAGGTPGGGAGGDPNGSPTLSDGGGGGGGYSGLVNPSGVIGFVIAAGGGGGGSTGGVLGAGGAGDIGSGGSPGDGSESSTCPQSNSYPPLPPPA